MRTSINTKELTNTNAKTKTNTNTNTNTNTKDKHKHKHKHKHIHIHKDKRQKTNTKDKDKDKRQTQNTKHKTQSTKHKDKHEGRCGHVVTVCFKLHKEDCNGVGNVVDAKVVQFADEGFDGHDTSVVTTDTDKTIYAMERALTQTRVG